jgi:capsular polysaccharide biosynthesis protein
LLSSKAIGYRHLDSVGLRDYCQLSGNSFQEHSSARTVECPLPANIANREDLNRSCGRYERSFFDVPDFQVSASFSATVQDCRILRTRDGWGDDFYAIVTPDDRLLQFSGTSFQPEHAALLRSGHVSRTIDAATWITPHSTRNHYMWLYNHLPRLMLAEQLGLHNQTLFPAKSLLSPVKLSTLDRLGYEEPQFIREQDEVIRIGSLSLMEADGFDPMLLTRLRDRLVGVPEQAARTRLYISREKCHYRKMKNETEVWPELEKKGFEKVFLEDLTLEQQIQKLHSADIVLGVHGAGFANILFCRPGTRIIEIQDPDDPNPHFYALAALLGHDYCLLLGDVDPAAESHFRDICMKPSAITGLLT